MNTLESWTEAVCAEFGIEPSAAATRAVLDVTRDVAHEVARPAAPLTAYLLGVAVGRGQALPDASDRIRALAAGWAGSTDPPAGREAGPEGALDPVRAAGRRPLPDSYGAAVAARGAWRSRTPEWAGFPIGRVRGRS